MPSLLRYSLALVALLGSLALGLPIGAGCGGTQTANKAKTLTPREIMQRYKPAIVRIENDLGAQIAVGTGFLVSPQGRIATNLHVIVGGGKLSVKLADHSVHKVARVVAIDKSHDLAVIEMDTKSAMPTLSLGDSDLVAPGDAVIAVGNPMQLDYTVSDGLISSVRPIKDDVILQISAPISQGSSGGPLFNAFGEVIGVATLVSAKGQNLNFGVPINYLRPLIAHKGSESVEQFAARFAPKKSIRQAAGNRAPIHREIPRHDVSLLKSCNKRRIVNLYTGITRAIELGAPLYNDGDHQACFAIYKQTAEHFEKDKALCKSVRDALGAGLLKAETKPDATSKAWAMRDAFDGLLQVIVERARSEP